MFENVVYISQLRPDFDVIDLENELQLDANLDEVIVDYVIQTTTQYFWRLSTLGLLKSYTSVMGKCFLDRWFELQDSQLS